MTNINLNSILFFLKSINFYGLVYTISFLFFYIYLEKSKIKYKYLFFYLVFINVIVFSRLFHILDLNNLSYYINNPINIIKIWQGGLAWYGGVFGFLLANIFYFYYINIKEGKRKLKEEINNLIEFYNNFILLLPIFIFLGRLANFINKEHLGQFGEYTPLFESFMQGVLLFLILLFSKDKIKSFIIYYSIIRFFTEFFRNNNFHFKWNHLIILIFMILSLYFYNYLKNYLKDLENEREKI